MNAFSMSKLENYTISTDSSKINLQSEEELLKSISKSSNGAFYFNFSDYKLEDILLSRVGLQIYKYESLYDLTLDVEQKELTQKISILELERLVVNLAAELQAHKFYCGYESAIDEANRLFFRDLLGCSTIWGNIDRFEQTK